jgi:uncharacterized protein
MKTDFNIIHKEVVSFLNKNCPDFLTYHNTAHTLYVLDKSIAIATKEKVGNNDLNLVKVAALYHDIGFTKTHIEHEKEGCKIAERQLKKYGYSAKDIQTVCGIIMATKIPQNPHTLLEQIVADADLEYLATAHFWPISELLYKELKHYNSALTSAEWNRIQIDFIKKHQFHTPYCKRYKKFRKFKNLARLEAQN